MRTFLFCVGLWLAFSIADLQANKGSKRVTLEVNKSGAKKEVGEVKPLAGIRFPKLSSESLSRERFALPGELKGEVVLALIAFKRWQQREVNTWVPFAKQLRRKHPKMNYYEFPTLTRGYRLMRFWIDGGMRRGIPNLKTRARTITLYTDKVAFRRALGIKGEEHIKVMVIDQKGRVYWRTSGPFAKKHKKPLKRLMRRLLKGSKKKPDA